MSLSLAECSLHFLLWQKDCLPLSHQVRPLSASLDQRPPSSGFSVLPNAILLGVSWKSGLGDNRLKKKFHCFPIKHPSASWRKKWQPTAVFLPGESHGQRSLADCSPWGHKESDTTDHTHIQVPGLLDSLSIWMLLGPYFPTATAWGLLAVFHYGQLASLFKVPMCPQRHLIYNLVLRFCLYFPPLSWKLFFYLYWSIVHLQKGLPGGSVIKNLPAIRETWVQSVGREDPLE